MMAYLRLLFRHAHLWLNDRIAIRLHRCPFCWVPTPETTVMAGGGVYTCRVCPRCGAPFVWANVTPQRPSEESASRVSAPF